MSEPIAAPAGGAAWTLPEVRGPVVTFRGRSGSVAAADADARAGYDEGFRKGREEGLAAARAESAAQARRMDETLAQLRSLLGCLAQPLERLDQESAAELARRGAWVEVMGARTTVDDLTDRAGTIGYELLTRLGRRVHRVYIEDEM